MLIKKETNGNVILYDAAVAENSVAILNEFPVCSTFGSDEIKISGYPKPIKVDEIYLDSGGGVSPWTGTRDELIEELSTNFFF